MTLSRSEFFKKVLPPTGNICLVGLMADESAPAIQRFYPLEDAFNGALDARITELENQGREVYFGCATYKDPRGQRTAKNALGYKCFRIDIDCGPAKPYHSQKAGLRALQKYLEEIKLPTPMLVNSGRGWHAYWTLTDTYEYNVWRPLADAFKQSLAALEFITDPAVPADGARILRIPGTHNTKDKSDPLPVEVVVDAPPITLEEFKAALEPYLPESIPKGMEMFKTLASSSDDPLMRKVLQSSEKMFSKILTRSLKQIEVVEMVSVAVEVNGVPQIRQQKQKAIRSAGCAQIAHIYQNQEAIDYNLWRAGLSIARNCSDWETAIHIISSQDMERYSYEDTVKCAEDTYDKPQYCTTFQQINPELCVSCPLRAKITTPITLGLTLTAAEPIDNIHEQVYHQGLGGHTHIEIPNEYPRPWFRPKMGGVATYGAGSGDDNEEDGDDSRMIYENDLWVQKLLDDPNNGCSAQIARMLPKDGLKEFTIPLAIVYKKDKCAEVLGHHGVAVHPAKVTMIQKYLMDWVKLLQTREETAMAREQFGWHDNDTAFVIGTREYRNDGTMVYSPPCSTTEHIAPLYMPKGDLEVWKMMINSTYGRVGNEERCYALFVAMGAPLYKFFNVNSSLLHLTNSASGVGKTTCQMAGGSVWGEPKKTMLTKSDTPLARQQRFGILNNLPAIMDELTNLPPLEASELVFTFSDDRGRNRMQSQVNAERRNHSSWNTVGISSGNNSMDDTLGALTSAAQGERYRISDLVIPRDNAMTKEQSDYYFNHLLRANYGVAGEVLLRYIVPNLDTVKEELFAEQKRFDADAGFDQQARNYSAMCASAFTMARIAKRLGVHDIDVDRVRSWVINYMKSRNQVVKEDSTEDVFAVLGEFLSENHRNMLVINDRSMLADSAMPVAPLREPYGDLIIRYEPNTRKIYIARDRLRAWCSDRRVPYTPFISRLKAQSGSAPASKMCLSRGTSIPGSPIWVECIEADAISWQLDTPLEQPIH